MTTMPSWIRNKFFLCALSIAPGSIFCGFLGMVLGYATARVVVAATNQSCDALVQGSGVPVCAHLAHLGLFTGLLVGAVLIPVLLFVHLVEIDKEHS